MGLAEKLKKIILGNPKKVVHVQIDPNSVEDNHQVKAIAYENAELKADNAKYKSLIGKMRERDQDKNEEENVKAVLNKQRNEIKLESQGQVFSLKKFYAKYFRDKKFRDKLGIYSFDRKTKLAGYGDIGICEDGDFALFDNDSNMILKMARLKDLFQSVGALGNDMARGMIPVNMDGEGGYIENIMVAEMPELIPNNEGKLWFAKARKKPVYEIIQGLNNQLGEISAELEESEAMNIALQDKIDRLSSENKVSMEMSETSRAELSFNENRLTGIDRSYRHLQRDLFNNQNMSSIQEDNIQKLENEVEIMRNKAERNGVKLSDERSLELINNLRATLVNELPDFSPQQVQNSKEGNNS